MEIFGDLERSISEDLYPYRWALSIGALFVLGAVAWVALQAGWIAAVVRWASQRPVIAGVSAALVLAVVLPTFWLLASPLWTRTTLVEESPLAVAAAATEAMTETATPSSGGAVVAAATSTPDMMTPDAMTATATPEAALPRLALEGDWQGADDFHFAEGRALIVETAPGVYTLRVEDFSVRNGPDLFVYVSPEPEGGIAGAVKLGELKATDGAFNYEIPPGVTLEQLRSAVVWCDAFAVLFGHARLTP